MSNNNDSQNQSLKKNKQRRISLIIAGVLLAIFLGALSMWLYIHGTYNKQAVTERDTLQSDGNLVTTTDEDAVSSVAEKVSPSVVSIVTNTTVSSIFGAAQQEAAGTGVIVSKDGYILTNKHVVNGASTIRVVTYDGTSYDKVKLVGTDPLNDIAYLKIEGANELAAIELGDSATIRVGQLVVAIGNALGQYQNTVTSGIISGKGRPITAASGDSSTTENLTDLLQTDAAINSGNSGGPLLNRSGQVIGINVAVASNAQGISFAIPINAVKGTLKSVLAGKGVKRAYLGVRYVSITPRLAKQYNLDVKEGAYIVADGDSAAVSKDGPADRAGVKDKDIITKINNLTVGKQGDVSSLIGEYQPGDVVELTILRNGKEKSIRVTLGSYGE
ncbi:MAG: trypsin-like peptidase domain-containing protein [Candidatus Saccharimonas sp.]